MKTISKRPNWDEYFMKLAMLASERATCPRMHCGCVLVRNKEVVATGYNGSIPGDDHCEDVGCLMVDNHCVRTVHAEMNALVQAAKKGHGIDGATAYVTNTPCTTCAKALITAGVKRIVIFSDYHDALALEFCRKAAVMVDKIAMPSKEILYDLEGYTSVRK